MVSAQRGLPTFGGVDDAVLENRYVAVKVGLSFSELLIKAYFFLQVVDRAMSHDKIGHWMCCCEARQPRVLVPPTCHNLLGKG
jgi:hypothetical protein